MSTTLNFYVNQGDPERRPTVRMKEIAPAEDYSFIDPDDAAISLNYLSDSDQSVTSKLLARVVRKQSETTSVPNIVTIEKTYTYTVKVYFIPDNADPATVTYRKDLPLDVLAVFDRYSVATLSLTPQDAGIVGENPNWPPDASLITYYFTIKLIEIETTVTTLYQSGGGSSTTTSYSTLVKDSFYVNLTAAN